MTKIAPNANEFRWSIRKHGKHVVNYCTRFARYSCTAMALMLGVSSMAMADPILNSVVSGNVSVTGTGVPGGDVTVDQTSATSIINWDSLDTVAGQNLTFNMTGGAAASSLNRVLGGVATSFGGNLISNGNVIIINPNGVVFGSTAVVDVNGLVASSADIADQAYLNDDFRFSQMGAFNAVVENQGQITVQDQGFVALVAPTVRNSGVISGRMARVALAAGDTFAVDLYGDGLLSLAVDGNSTNRTISATNTGSIITDGGRIAMTAAAANSVVNSVINASGIIDATSVTQANGEIFLTGKDTTVNVTGALSGGTLNIGDDFVSGADVKARDVIFGTGTSLDGQVIRTAAGRDVNINTDINIANAGTNFKIDAKRDINITNADVTTNGGSFDFKSGHYIIVTNAQLDTNGGDMIFNSGCTIKLDNTISNTDGGNMDFDAYNLIEVKNNSNVATSGGDIDFNINNKYIRVSNSGITTSGGSVNFRSNTGFINTNNADINTNGGNVDFTISGSGSNAYIYSVDSDYITNGGSLTFKSIKNGGRVKVYSTAIATNGGNVNMEANSLLSIKNGSLIETSGGDFNGRVHCGNSEMERSNIYTEGGDVSFDVYGTANFNYTNIDATNYNAEQDGVITLNSTSDNNSTANAFRANPDNRFSNGPSGGEIKVKAKKIQGANNCFSSGGAIRCGYPEPTSEPTPEPTSEPTPEPTSEPTPEPTSEPTPEPTSEPTPEPTSAPQPQSNLAPFFEIDPLGRPIISVANQAIVLDEPFEEPEVRDVETDVSINQKQGPGFFVPGQGNNPTPDLTNVTPEGLAGLEPAAGGEPSAEGLADLEPAAGGGLSTVCGNAFLADEPCEDENF